jgi:hypothetical protein
MPCHTTKGHERKFTFFILLLELIYYQRQYTERTVSAGFETTTTDFCNGHNTCAAQVQDEVTCHLALQPLLRNITCAGIFLHGPHTYTLGSPSSLHWTGPVTTTQSSMQLTSQYCTARHCMVMRFVALEHIALCVDCAMHASHVGPV